MTWDDDTSDEEKKNPKSEKPDTGKEKFMAFMKTSVSVTPQISFDHETDHNDSESEAEHEWKIEYLTLFEKTLKML